MKAKEGVKDIISFYERKFDKKKFYLPPNSFVVRLGLLLSIYSVQRFFETNVKKTKFLLDLGCGGGWELFAKKAEKVIGIDISKASLKVAKKNYYDCAKADIGHLPFKDSSFDFVASSDVLGHIPSNSKQEAISENFRVLKGGGKTFHCLETDGQGPLPTWAKKYSSLHRKYLIELDGHYGLEFPKRAIKRFKAKFRVCAVKKVYSGLFWPITEYVKRFDNEFKNKSVLINTITNLSKTIVKNFYLHAMIDCALGVLSRIFDFITPLDWADGIYALCKKHENKYLK